MARRKKPDDETIEQAEVRRILETIADTATRSEKVSWDRKMDNMVRLLARLRPIEEQLLDLMAQKGPLLDEVQGLRKDMVKDCVHPYTHLTYNENDGTIVCKFCERKFAIREMNVQASEDADEAQV